MGPASTRLRAHDPVLAAMENARRDERGVTEDERLALLEARADGRFVSHEEMAKALEDGTQPHEK
ncbi:hypothetical protein [Pendulispora albinea]|uniref:Antitoxin VbhA domain-containing protein n=1 Tax=Pendulispora albinea TaxID=2741071 RepID=A0ABZ2LY72_9BACT